MIRKSKWLLLAVVFAMIAAACGSDAAEETTATTATTATEATTATTAATPDETTATTEAEVVETPDEVLTDVGVDSENKVITVGLLSDLTGPFGGLVGLIVAGQTAYWDNLNANGGIDGWTVEMEIRDTAYNVENHVTLYGELKEDVVAFAHSTGSPHTIAINDQLKEDNILAIPLTWYSGWSDPVIGTNLLAHGTPYCIEAMNLIGYLADLHEANTGEKPTIAVAGDPGDYGEDSVEGAKIAAEALGLEIVYDGQGLTVTGQDQTPITTGIVESDADIVFLTTNFGVYGEIYGGALASGFTDRIWTGATPSYNPAAIGAPFAESYAVDFYGSQYGALWGDESEGYQEMMAIMIAANPDLPISDFLAEGWVEATIMEAVLRRAINSGDLTQAGVLAAGQSLELVEFGGIAPNARYAGSPNDNISRSITIHQVDLAGFVAQGGALTIGAEGGGFSGSRAIETDYTHPVAASYQFDEACWSS